MRSHRGAALTGLVVLFAVLTPLLVVALLSGRLQRTGDVSHWPWEEHGVLGWWLIPVSFWCAVACNAARGPRPGLNRSTMLLVTVAAVMSLSLLYNP